MIYVPVQSPVRPHGFSQAQLLEITFSRKMRREVESSRLPEDQVRNFQDDLLDTPSADGRPQQYWSSSESHW